MNEELQEQLVKRFTKRFQDYNEKVLEELGCTIKQFGKVLPSEAYKLAQQLKYNTTVEELEKELVRITGKTMEEVQTILEHIAKENIVFAEPFYKAKGLNVPIYEEHKQLQKLVSSFAVVANQEFLNIAKSTGFKLLDNDGEPLLLNIEETYHKVIDEAVYAITTGKDSYDQQMREIIKQLSASGVRNIEYESGYSRRIDTAIRMNLMDTIRQVSNESSRIIGEEFGADGIEVSVHQNPAPDHEKVQGHQFSKEEFEKFQNDQDCYDYKGNLFTAEFNGHDRRAISEYNCYHYIFYVVLGVSNPLYSDEELKDIINNNKKGIEIDGRNYTNYETNQLLRKIEAEIRQSKEQQIIAKASGDEELVLKAQKRIRQLTNKYRDISKQVNVKEDVTRLFVPNYQEKRIKTIYNDVTQEWLDKADTSYQELLNATSVKKGEKIYQVNKTNKIEFLNRERENAEWFVNKFGGKIEFLPTIQEDGGISCSDYKYFPKKNDNEWFYLEEKETNKKGKNIFYHALEDKEDQATTFLIDCTDSAMSIDEIQERVKRVFTSKKTQYVETIIVKNDNDLVGVFSNNKKK